MALNSRDQVRMAEDQHIHIRIFVHCACRNRTKYNNADNHRMSSKWLCNSPGHQLPLLQQFIHHSLSTSLWARIGCPKKRSIAQPPQKYHGCGKSAINFATALRSSRVQPGWRIHSATSNWYAGKTHPGCLCDKVE